LFEQIQRDSEQRRQRERKDLEERRLFVAAKLAGLDAELVRTFNQQLFSNPRLTWNLCYGEVGFMGELDFLFLNHLTDFDPVAELAIRMRCAVYGHCSDTDFQRLPDSEQRRFIGCYEWSLCLELSEETDRAFREAVNALGLEIPVLGTVQDDRIRPVVDKIENLVKLADLYLPKPN